VQFAVKECEAKVATATEAMMQMEAEVGHLKEARTACMQQVEAKAKMLVRHEALQKSYTEWAIKISERKGRSQAVEADIQQLGQWIAEAEQQEEAARKYTQLTVSIQECQNRLLHLELVKERYKALVTQQAAFRQVDIDLQRYTTVDQQQKAAEKLAVDTEAAWKALQIDPTTAEMLEWQQRQAYVALQEQHVTEALRTLKDATQDSECPTCGQTLTTHSRENRVQHLNRWQMETLPGLRAELATEKAALDHSKAKWAQARQAAFEAMQAQQKKLQSVLRLVDQRATLRQRCTQVESELCEAQKAWDQLGEAQQYNPDEAAELDARVEALKTEAVGFQDAAKRYAQLPLWRKQLVQKQCQSQALQRELAELTQAQVAVEYDSATHEHDRQEHTAAVNTANDVERNLTNANQKLSQHQLASERDRDALERAIQLQDRFADAAKAFQREDHLFTFLSEFQEHFFTANVGRVVERATQLLRHAVTDQSILGIRFDHDSLVYLDASHHPRSVARLSGGEKALMGLCLRIALAEQAQAITRTGKVSFLVLDEVLSSLDDERREAVQRIFEDVLHRGIFEHIIMITHLDSVKHGWRGATLEVHKIDSKTSKVTAGMSDSGDAGLAEPVEGC
jgi:DNA repair exonuclease SbcCD ATPase subunit